MSEKTVVASPALAPADKPLPPPAGVPVQGMPQIPVMYPPFPLPAPPAGAPGAPQQQFYYYPQQYYPMYPQQAPAPTAAAIVPPVAPVCPPAEYQPQPSDSAPLLTDPERQAPPPAAVASYIAAPTWSSWGKFLGGWANYTMPHGGRPALKARMSGNAHQFAGNYLAILGILTVFVSFFFWLSLIFSVIFAVAWGYLLWWRHRPFTWCGKGRIPNWLPIGLLAIVSAVVLGVTTEGYWLITLMNWVILCGLHCLLWTEVVSPATTSVEMSQPNQEGECPVVTPSTTVCVAPPAEVSQAPAAAPESQPSAMGDAKVATIV